MSNLKEAAQQALDALESVQETEGRDTYLHVDDAIDVLRAVLAQPDDKAQPVAWLRNLTDAQPHAVTHLKFRSALDAENGVEYIPVYAAPQPPAEHGVEVWHDQQGE